MSEFQEWGEQPREEWPSHVSGWLVTSSAVFSLKQSGGSKAEVAALEAKFAEAGYPVSTMPPQPGSGPGPEEFDLDELVEIAKSTPGVTWPKYPGGAVVWFSEVEDTLAIQSKALRALERGGASPEAVAAYGAAARAVQSDEEATVALTREWVWFG